MHIHTATLDREEYLGLIGEDHVVLVGSGVSMWEPSGLPAGQMVSDYVIAELLRQHEFAEEIPTEKLIDLIQKLPFEVLLSKCERHDLVKDWLLRMFSGAIPNSMHHAIVDHALQSKTRFIVTTNYDRCIELALEERGISYHLIERPDDLTSFNVSKDITLFKLHGTARHGAEDTMIFSETQEARMPDWKRNLLRTYLQGRVLSIFGYSGLDFEVCPELDDLNIRRVIWSFYSRDGHDRSPGRLRLQAIASSKSPEITGLIGDMGAMANAHWSLSAPVVLSTSARAVPPLVGLDQSLWQLWLARVVQALGIGHLALNIMNGIETKRLERISKKLAA